MDDSAPLKIAKGTALTSLASAATFGLYGAYKGKGRLTGALVASAALNGGLTAATFFSIREVAVSPLFDYLRSSGAQGTGSSLATSLAAPLSWSDMRTHKVLDSALSGSITGGLLNAWKRGPSGALPGITTGGVLLALAQLVLNEVDVMRVKSMSRLSQPAPPVPQTPQRPLWHRLLDRIGVHRLTDDEYLAKMKASRDTYLQRIRELEKEIEDEAHDSEATARRPDA
ncbi:hypothetical protein PLICRDRAFT_54134 [Plicaturopsis crispa FD-325 SS-3]|nr:hypothetical protein PLICRDRAFT_54134 [Plicaturopsis crispa FD-325 SS-3]